MKIKLFTALFTATLAIAALPAQSETVRDCVMEGTVKKHSGENGQVYVAFHSAKAAEAGANCRIRPNEKLKFKESRTSDLSEAKPGTRVEYRYTEDSDTGADWKLQKVTSS